MGKTGAKSKVPKDSQAVQTFTGLSTMLYEFGQPCFMTPFIKTALVNWFEGLTHLITVRITAPLSYCKIAN